MPLFAAMLALDIVVIYIACGAPFAAAAFLERGARIRLGHVLTSFAAVLYWPFLVPKMLRRISGRGQYLSDSTHDRRSDSNEEILRSKLLDAWSDAFGSKGINKFREKLERYAALSLELSAESKPDPNELAAIVGHPAPAVNSICRARLDRRKLELHRTAARIDLIEAMDVLILAAGSEIIAIAADLATSVGDGDAIAEIAALATIPDASAAAA